MMHILHNFRTVGKRLRYDISDNKNDKAVQCKVALNMLRSLQILNFLHPVAIVFNNKQNIVAICT